MVSLDVLSVETSLAIDANFFSFDSSKASISKVREKRWIFFLKGLTPNKVLSAVFLDLLKAL